MARYAVPTLQGRAHRIAMRAASQPSRRYARRHECIEEAGTRDSCHPLVVCGGHPASIRYAY
jgi:hypothetical protein